MRRVRVSFWCVVVVCCLYLFQRTVFVEKLYRGVHLVIVTAEARVLDDPCSLRPVLSLGGVFSPLSFSGNAM